MKEKAPRQDGGDSEATQPSVRMEPSTTYRSRVPVHDLTSRITPSSDVFVLSHFGTARIDVREWKLSFSGLLKRQHVMSFEDIRAFARYEVEAFIKCAGFPANHRIATRNASNVLWAGARLADVMRSVGVLPHASHLWFSAFDHGTYDRWSAGRYVKDLEISRALMDDVLLAYEMNGEPLSAEHGFPLRLLVPGFYGTNSVKWLSHIEAAAGRPSGLFTNELYNDPVFSSDGSAIVERAPVWGVAPEALIVSPANNAELQAGRIDIWGWCWGEHPIASVEISLDEGRTWSMARVAIRHQRSWQRFDFTAEIEIPGELTVLARATDCKGGTQPHTEARNSIHQVRATIVS